MSYTIADIVDAIANDLAPIAKAAMPAAGNDYLDWRHASPDMLNPEQAPWLAVFSPNSVHTLIATIGEYQDDDDITIEWAVSLTADIEQGGALNPEIVRAAQVQAAPILERLRCYADGLPTPFTNQVVGTLTRTNREDAQALVYRQSWTLTVTSMGAE